MSFCPIRLILSAVLGVGSVSSAIAADWTPPGTIEVDAVGADGTLKLGDGDAVCLAGIWAPETVASDSASSRWQSAWWTIIEDGSFIHPANSPLRRNRYGCLINDLKNEDGRSLAAALLEAGWALVAPTTAPGEAAVIDSMLVLESRARRARRGIWKDGAVLAEATGELASRIGTRQIVEGRVRRVSGNDRYVYLNFGADWRTDFTTRLDRKMMKAADVEAGDYDGQKLRVRGVLVESRGPLIDVSNLKQIEFLP